MLWNDPDRWVDSDMQRDEWVRLGLGCAAIAITVLLIMLIVLWYGSR